MQVNEVVVNGVTELSLVNDTVSEDTLLEGATSHDASGNQITGKFVPYNPNLLDNPDFSINQRGQTEYDLKDVAYGYTVDRWGVGWAKGFTKKLTVSDDGVTLSSSGGEAYLYQRRENPKDYYNKPFTFSLSIESISGSVVMSAVGNSSINGTVSMSPIEVTEPGVVSITFNPGEIYTALRIQTRISNGGSVKINRAKLELGEIQTLARQDAEGNWVIIDSPPNSALELAKCQRFLTSLMQSSVYRAVAIGTDYIDFSIPTPTTMRPISGMSIVNPENFVVRSINPTADQTGFSFSVVTYGANQLRLRALKAAHGLTDATLAVKSSSTVFLSAEL